MSHAEQLAVRILPGSLDFGFGVLRFFEASCCTAYFVTYYQSLPATGLLHRRHTMWRLGTRRPHTPARRA